MYEFKKFGRPYLKYTHVCISSITVINNNLDNIGRKIKKEKMIIMVKWVLKNYRILSDETMPLIYGIDK